MGLVLLFILFVRLIQIFPRRILLDLLTIGALGERWLLLLDLILLGGILYLVFRIFLNRSRERLDGNLKASLKEGMQKLAEGDLSHRIPSPRGGKMAELSDSFNHMAQELEHNWIRIVQTEKVRAWQEMAQRLAHEINNPLTPIKLSAQRLAKRYQEDAPDFSRILDSSVESIVREVDKLERLLREFDDFSRRRELRKEGVQLRSLINEVTALYEELPRDSIQIEIDQIPEDLFLSLDPRQIRRVFFNLISNAVEAMPQGGTLSFCADLVKRGNTHYCEIQVKDTGEGIDRRRFSQVFNPYYTTKSEGAGLGLSVAKRIIFDHQGQIWFESEPGVGTTFFIYLPVETA